MKHKKRKKSGMGLLVVLVTLLCGAVLFATEGVKNERDVKLQAQAQLQAQIAEQQEETEKLKAQKDYTSTRRFIEEMARKVLGLVYPDEILFEEEKE